MADRTDSSTSDITAVFGVLRRRWLIIALCVLTGIGAALAFTALATKQYTAMSQLLFRDPGLDQKLFGSSFAPVYEDPARVAATNVRLVSVDDVARRTADKLGGGLTMDDVSSRVVVEAEGESNVVDVRATDEDPRRAALIANTFAEQYIVFRRRADRGKIKEAIQLVEAQLDRFTAAQRDTERGRSLEDRAQDLRILASLQTGNAEVIQRASTPRSPSAPNPRRNLALGAFVGLMLGLAAAFAREQIDRRLTRADALASEFDAPLLGEIPRSRALANRRAEPGHLPAMEREAFQLLRVNLQHSGTGAGRTVFAVTSPTPQDGKSTVALNLAAVAASSGVTTLLIEADMRKPVLANALGLRSDLGLVSLLTDEAVLHEAIAQVEVTASQNGHGPRVLDVLPAGHLTDEPGALLDVPRLQRLVAQAREQYDLVIIDTPPATIVSDTIPLITAADGVIIVGRLGHITRERASRLRQQLSQTEAVPVGVVANFAPRSANAYYSYSDYAKATT